MLIKIKVLNVGDGDAIIVFLKRENSSLLFLIDGGHPGDADNLLSELNLFLNESGKSAPDFILCTHYDNDHIGGLFSVVKYFGKNISRIWMHKTSGIFELISSLKKGQARNEKSSVLPSEDDDYLMESETSSNFNGSELEEVLRSLQQEVDFINLVESMGIPISEPIAEYFSIEEWPELRMLGPTKQYYQKLFPKHFSVNEVLKDELEYIRNEKLEVENYKGKENPCEALDAMPKSKLTPTNLNSAILLLEGNSKKFLFAGDAGVASFEAIPNYPEALVSLYWLKVPHHASKNNINSKLIGIMRPKFSFISGKRHISPKVVQCLKAHGSTVSITSESGHLLIEDC